MIFVYCANFFSFFVKRLPAGLPKLKCTFPQQNLERKYFVEKIVCVLFLFRSEPKTFGALAKAFRQRCEDCFWCVHRVILRNFFEKQIPFIILANWATPFWHWVGDFRAGLLENTILFFNHFRILSEQFLLFRRKKAVGLPKLVPTCLQEQFEKKNFLKKSFKFFFMFFGN